MAHQAGVCSGFCSMRRLGIFLLPLYGMLVHRRAGLPPAVASSKFAGTHFYTWVKRGTMAVKYVAQEHNVMPRPGLDLGSLDPVHTHLNQTEMRNQPIRSSMYCPVILLCTVYEVIELIISYVTVPKFGSCQSEARSSQVNSAFRAR